MFCVGLIGEKQISAFSICFQVEGFAWMVILLFCLIIFSFFAVMCVYSALLLCACVCSVYVSIHDLPVL